MPPLLAFLMSGALAATSAPGTAADDPQQEGTPSGGLQTSKPTNDAPCRQSIQGDIVVCATRDGPYRIAPEILESNRQLQSNSRSAVTRTPPAEAACLASKSGCGHGLESLDIANVAVVLATAGVKAATGKDWSSAFRTGGKKDYELYKEAKRRRDLEEDDRAAAEVRRRARAEQRSPHE